MNRWSNNTEVGMPNTTRQAACLLNQQIWCWGRDVEYSGGNLLLRHGFQRIEKPVGSNAASLYRLELSPTSRVILRGFGVFCGDDRWGGLFLRRFGFVPQLTTETELSRPLWSAEDLPPLASPHADQVPYCRWLLLTLIDWIRDYEDWIVEREGIAYRAATLLDWNAKNGTVLPEGMASAWRMLAAAVSDCPEKFICRLN